MRVKALKRHGYGGETYKQGDEYFIDNVKHARILVATRTIKIMPVRAETPKPEPAKPKKSKANKNTYGRKDLQAGSPKKKAKNAKAINKIQTVA